MGGKIIIILTRMTSWEGPCHILASSSSYNSDLTAGLAHPCKIGNCTSELPASNMTLCSSKLTDNIYVLSLEKKFPSVQVLHDTNHLESITNGSRDFLDSATGL